MCLRSTCGVEANRDTNVINDYGYMSELELIKSQMQLRKFIFAKYVLGQLVVLKLMGLHKHLKPVRHGCAILLRACYPGLMRAVSSKTIEAMNVSNPRSVFFKIRL